MAKVIKGFLTSNAIPTVPWAPQSLDLNPIECLWGGLEKRVRQRPISAISLVQLQQFLEEEWAKIPVQFIHDIVDSMPQRVHRLMEMLHGIDYIHSCSKFQTNIIWFAIHFTCNYDFCKK